MMFFVVQVKLALTLQATLNALLPKEKVKKTGSQNRI